MNEELSSILEKVGCLYLKYGIKSVTMDDVARELGISKKTLYKHVKDKNDLVEQVIKIQAKKKQAGALAITGSKSLNAIQQIFEIYKYVHEMILEYSPTVDYDLRKYYPDLYNRLALKQRQGMYENMLRNMKRGKKEKLYREELNEKVIARLHVIRVESIMRTDFSEDEFSKFDFFKEVFEYHIHGIVSEKGLKLYKELKQKYNNEN